MKIAALIVAAGRGKRAGAGAPKQYRHVGGEAVLTRSIRALLKPGLIDMALVCIHPDDRAAYDAAAPVDPRLLPPSLAVQSGRFRCVPGWRRWLNMRLISC